MGKTVLIVDDEKNIVDILSFNLIREGYEILCAYDGREGLELALKKNPDLILLDIMLPYMDGFEVCREFRKKNNLTPIIMLTAREEEEDKIFGLELGADDYISKPFSVRELLARVKTNIRRSASTMAAPEAGTPTLTFGELLIDTDSKNVFKNGVALELSMREYELLTFLASNAGTVFSREELLENVWNYKYYGDLRAVDVAVKRLREKVETNTSEPQYIMTRRGAGYYFNK
ncbi:MAG: response regulator transcription factor [Clostridiales bacterium]|jgi:two-component system response regulator VicR|nr:response regulator transcription factor [Clostridiales bacterium]